MRERFTSILPLTSCLAPELDHSHPEGGLMLAKYIIEYSVQFRRHAHPCQHITDDPVAATEFLADLLERGFRVCGIQHEGVALSLAETDRMLKSAAGMLAARHLARSLGMSMEEVGYRFGFSG